MAVYSRKRVREAPSHAAWREVLVEAAREGFTPTVRNIAHWVSWAVTLAIVLALTALLQDGRIYGWEVDVAREIQGYDVPGWVHEIFADKLTNSDTPIGAVVIGSVVLGLWMLRLRLEAALAALSVPLHILGNFPKAIVERERPAGLIDGIDGIGGMKSFPSGHVEYAITFYGFLVFIALLRIRNAALRGLLVAAWLATVVVVALARIEGGRHWPLDVIGGSVVGIGLLSGLIWLHRSFSVVLARSAADGR
jgi:membrane-associated phospholipid phosphatase